MTRRNFFLGVHTHVPQAYFIVLSSRNRIIVNQSVGKPSHEFLVTGSSKFSVCQSMWWFRPSPDSVPLLIAHARLPLSSSSLIFSSTSARSSSLRRRQWERGDVVAALSATIISVQLPANYWMKTEDRHGTMSERKRERKTSGLRARESQRHR